MKSALPWILAVIFLAGAGYLFSVNRSQTAQLADLSAKAARADQLQAENDQLKAAPDQSAELTRLRGEHEELLSLRSQVNQLGEENKKLNSDYQKALAQSGQVQQQQQQTSSELQSLRLQSQHLQAAQAAEHLSICVNNLKLIQAAKQQWALENNKPAIAVPKADDLAAYLPGKTMPICPDGGTYIINAVGVPAACTVQGHVLPAN